jgi:hypothetical protein
MGAHAATFSSHVTRRAAITRVTVAVLLSSAAFAALLGPFVIAGHNRPMLPMHELLGDIAVFALWTLAFIGSRAGISRRLVMVAAMWGLAEWVFVGAQRLELGAMLHLATQVLHVASGVGVAVLGAVVARSVLQHETSARTEPTLRDAAEAFLACKRIAVTGVSREPKTHGANVVYRRLRERGYVVFAINPNAEQVEGDKAYRDLRSVPGGVDAVVIATRPAHAIETMGECAALGIRDVWMHKGIAGSSVSAEATAWGRARGMRVIDGGCPLMFGPAADVGHRAMRGLMTLTGKLPHAVPRSAPD